MEDEIDRLGDEIALLSAHIQAAMGRWLGLVAEFDERKGWAEWGCKSCAHWLSWRCSIVPGAAREHVRVARRLRELPLVAAALGRGELSYSKARALTRIEDIEREDALLNLAQTATAAQLEKIVRGCRRVTRAEAMRAYEERYLRAVDDEDGSVIVRGRLSAEDGALLRKALEVVRAARAEDVSAGTPTDQRVSAETRDAEALVALADLALTAPPGKERSGGDRHQVVVHIDADTLAEERAEGRAQLENGSPLAAETARRISCDASIVGLVERDGKPLSVGRKTRSIPPSLRRAMRSRDGGCGFPGCDRRRFLDAHHITHWAHGGDTSLDNLIHLCGHHHRLVHEGGYRVDRSPSGALVFRRPDGQRIAAAPRPPRGDHHALTRRPGASRLTPDSCRPRWGGERLDLPYVVDVVLDMTAGVPGGPSG